MDMYSKVVLSVIALLLIAIAIKLWQPDDYATVGDLYQLRSQASDQKYQTRDELLQSVPLVRVYGTVDISGSVDVDNMPHIYGTVEVENTVEVEGSVHCY